MARRNQVTLSEGMAGVALLIQEATGDLSNRDVQSRLSDAVNDAYRNTGMYAYYVDHIGDSDGGDVVYYCSGKTKTAPYSLSAGGDGTAATYDIDLDKAEPVYPRTIYEPMPDEEEHYASMAESYVAKGLYTQLPLYERFVSKKEREGMAAEDFAGKGKSFPINSPADVSAAARSIGRAGSDNLGPSTIKSKIIAIAKRKGWAKYLPKAWQDGGDASTTAKESADLRRQSNADLMILVESAVTAETIELREGAASKSSYDIKLIAPGPGSSAYYPAAVLKRDGPQVFKEGTKVFLNHQTAAEEKARPEGDVSNLAGVFTSDAEYRESHIGPAGKEMGPGLYAKIKVFADHAQTVEEKAKYVGMSIRAAGSQAVQEGRKLIREGLPVLGKFHRGKSVDIVAEAGAGGLIMTEAAKKNKAMKDAKDCTDCKGTGDCATCDGKGEIKAKESSAGMTECTDCSGTGECATCEGDGKIMESARRRHDHQENNVELNEVKRLIDDAVKPLNDKLSVTESALAQEKTVNSILMGRLLEGDARKIAGEAMEGMPLRESARAYVISMFTGENAKNLPLKDGQVDSAKLKESVVAEAKKIAAIVGETNGLILGMGAGAANLELALDPKEAERIKAEDQHIQESAIDTLAVLAGRPRTEAERTIKHEREIAA